MVEEQKSLEEIREIKKRYNKVYVMAPKLIMLYDSFEDFKEYQSINEKFWLDIKEFISTHEKHIIEKYAISRYGREWYEKNIDGFSYIEDWKFVERDIKYRRMLTKIFTDKIINEINHLKRLNDPFLPPLYKEKDIDAWFGSNYRIMGFNYIKSTGKYPDYECMFRMEPSKILFDFRDNIRSLEEFLSRYHTIGGYEINVELEYKSGNFLLHRHDPNIVDIIICYKKDKDIFDHHKNNIPIIELKELVDNRFVYPLEDKDDYKIDKIQDETHDIRDIIFKETLFYNRNISDITRTAIKKSVDYYIKFLKDMKISNKIKDFIHDDFEIRELLDILEKNNFITKDDIRELNNL